MAFKGNFMSFMDSEPHDRVPIYLFDVTLGMEAAGIDTDVIYVNGFDGEKSARSLLALQRYLGYDAVNGSTSWFDNRVFGNDIVFPKKGIPYHGKYCLSNPSNLYNLDHSSIPGKLLDQLALSHRLVREGTDAALVTHVPSPLGAAVGLRGLEYVIMDMLRDSDYVRDMLDFCVETIRIVTERVFEDVHPDMGLISGANDNVGLIGTDGIRDVSTPYAGKVIKLLSKGCGKVCFHPHGELHLYPEILKGYESIGVQVLYYGDSCEPLEIHRTIPDMPMMGGIDTFTTLTLGDERRVISDTERYVRMMDGINYCFSCSCSVDRGLSLEYVKAMVDTVRRVGKYDVHRS